MAHSKPTGRGRRWTAEQEKEAGRAIRVAEARALELIAEVPLAQMILNQTPRRAEKTKAGAVARLEEAIEAIWEASMKDDSLREIARAALGARPASWRVRSWTRRI